MMRCLRKLVVLGVVAAAAVLASQASAAGPWPGVAQGWDGVLATGAAVRYVAMPAAHSTVVAKVRVRDGRVLAFNDVPGAFGIPAVTLDGTTGGLTRDGKRLILAQPPTGEQITESRLLVLETKKLHLVNTITLKGDYAFDAFSPDGTTMYLIQHESGNPLQYLVRAYDFRTSRLVAAPIVDKSEPNEDMAGFPMRRTTSRDGSWVYTLYVRDKGTPFVHALDARGGAAHCIDLPSTLAGFDQVGSARFALSADERSLVISTKTGTRIAAIDTATFKVS